VRIETQGEIFDQNVHGKQYIMEEDKLERLPGRWRNPFKEKKLL